MADPNYLDPTLDPFTAAHAAIWYALEQHHGFCSLVKKRNRIIMVAESFYRFKDEVLASDLPEACLVQGRFNLMPFGSNSRSSEFSQSYSLIIVADDLKVVPVNQIKYQTAIALLKAGDTLGLPCIRSWNITDASDDALGQREWTRKSERWLSTLTIGVSLYKQRSDLMAIP